MTSKKQRPVCVFALLTFVLTGCATGPPIPERDANPLTNLSSFNVASLDASVPISSARSKSAGLILTDQTETSLEYIEAWTDWAERENDMNPEYLVDRLLERYKSAFASVTLVDNLQAFEASGLDVAIVVDMYTRLPHILPGTVEINLENVIFDGSPIPTARISSTGSQSSGSVFALDVNLYHAASDNLLVDFDREFMRLLQ